MGLGPRTPEVTGKGGGKAAPKQGGLPIAWRSTLDLHIYIYVLGYLNLKT